MSGEEHVVDLLRAADREVPVPADVDDRVRQRLRRALAETADVSSEWTNDGDATGDGASSDISVGNGDAFQDRRRYIAALPLGVAAAFLLIAGLFYWSALDERNDQVVDASDTASEIDEPALAAVCGAPLQNFLVSYGDYWDKATANGVLVTDDLFALLDAQIEFRAELVEALGDETDPATVATLSAIAESIEEASALGTGIDFEVDSQVLIEHLATIQTNFARFFDLQATDLAGCSSADVEWRRPES